MGQELNWTYICPNEKHTKTYRRHKNNYPVCPLCGQLTVRYILPLKSTKRVPKYMWDENTSPYEKVTTGNKGVRV